MDVRSPNGYLATWLGSLAGVLMLGALTGAVVYAFTRDCRADAFECLGAAIVALFAGVAGALVGAVFGAHAALRLLRYPAAGLTAWIFAGLLALLVIVVSFVATGIDDGAGLSVVTLCVMAVLPLLARRVALGVARRRTGAAEV